jgi:hypothetical protein
MHGCWAWQAETAAHRGEGGTLARLWLLVAVSLLLASPFALVVTLALALVLLLGSTLAL